MRVDVTAQTVKIMQEICAFLNAEGGHLYLGVSDIGYEMGLEEDLKTHSSRDLKTNMRYMSTTRLFTISDRRLPTMYILTSTRK